MLKRLGLFFVLSVVVINVVAQVATPKKMEQQTKVENVNPITNPNAADFKFEIEEHNFGNIPEGPEVKYDFIFTNTGKEPLIISDVHASCGCTTPVWPREPILPGAKSKITAVYNTKGRPGTFNKSITIKSNGKTAEKMLIIKGTVEAGNSVNSTPSKAPNIINTFPK
jgi:hypothetical protein